MIDFDKYLLPSYEYYLQEIRYVRIEEGQVGAEYTLLYSDEINAECVGNEKLVVTVSRKLKFEPKGGYELSVTFGGVFTLNSATKDEVNWEKVSVAKEFGENGQHLIAEFMSRISLQIAQITSSFGQTPIVTPPVIYNLQ